MKVKLSIGEAMVGVRYRTTKRVIGQPKPVRLPSRVVPGMFDENRQPIMRLGKIMKKDGQVVMTPALEIEQRSTEMWIKLPNGCELATVIMCDSDDQFSKAMGRRAALKDIIQQDTKQAQHKAEKVAMAGNLEQQVKAVLSARGSPSLMTESQKYYMLSREDRKTLFRAVCPDLFRDDAERVALRERVLLEQLKAKYEPSDSEDLKQAAK